ncbi:MAG: M50 family metallopeptidase [Candidatus Saccharimonadales bacterium]
MMVLAGILLFALLVVIHEFGHFIVARRNGVAVEEFGIGFPPKLFGKQIGETEYTFNLIPLGGFVKLKGESDSATEPASFGAAALWVKTKILLAGVGMNIVAAVVIMLLLALSGLPQILPDQYRVASNQTLVEEAVVITRVGDESAAAAAGVEVGDRIERINDTEIGSAEELSAVTDRMSGQNVTLHLNRDGESLELATELGTSETEGQLGVAPLDLSSSRYTWAAPLVAVGITLQMIGLVLLALWNILAGIFSGAGGAAAEQLTGPVGVIYLLQNLGDFGFEYLLFLLASISVSLAVFNALPVPALDGGRLAVIAGARALKRSLSPRLENAIHGLGFILLIGVFIVTTYVDIQRIF